MRKGRAATARALALAGCALLVAGCASQGTGADYDPFEPANRKVFWFNNQVDRFVLEPAAKGYAWVLPDPVERAVSRFFKNLRFPVNFVNCLLQDKGNAAGEEAARFAINTTVGILGLFDPASRMNIEPHKEDFGQSMATWGIEPGPYVVIPLLGPSNVRDGVGIVPDSYLAIASLFRSFEVLVGSYVLGTLNARAMLLDEVDTAKAAALDFYVFVRNAYYQQRVQAIADGEVVEAADDEYYDDEDLYDDSLYDDSLYDDEPEEPAP